MNKTYKGFWLILLVSFVSFFTLSAFDSFKIGGVELKTSGMIDRLTRVPEGVEAEIETEQVSASVVEEKKPRVIDETPQTILFVGDSMLEGLYPRLAAYAAENGHTLYSVIWYSSTSEVWGNSTKLAEYIEKCKPTYIFVSLGANELFVKNIAEKRDKYVKNILSQIGNIPFVWIGPPNWKPDTGINDLVAKNVKRCENGSFFVSNGMHFDRAKDGAHPTRKSARAWMDSVARWMPANAAHPIKMNLPKVETAKAKRVFMHQPNEK
jgi:lysophospholipase L1-like esterase